MVKVCFIFFFLTIPFAAPSLTGAVVSVSDGDTIVIADSRAVTHTIRLAGIDAPEMSQLYGISSKISLADLIYQRTVHVKGGERYRYRKMAGKILEGERDISLLQINAGMAWHYKLHQSQQSMIDQGVYSDAENIARMQKRGLWVDHSAIPPWDFRQLKGANGARKFRNTQIDWQHCLHPINVI